MTSAISIDADAAGQLATELAGRILRISFTTGCGGSGYRLASADEPYHGDTVLSIDGLTVALDEMANRNLDGAVIKWDESEGGFILDHPSAVTAVWCG
ncbi:MAG: iron-sulfur cluster biosynthesis family protein [Thermoanaerobaculia bacterium]|jgi:Fe-S cluster assembly iron-binding protein IscA